MAYKSSRRKKRNLLSSRYVWVAAGAVIIVAALAAWWVWHDNNTPSSTAVSAKNVIPSTSGSSDSASSNSSGSAQTTSANNSKPAAGTSGKESGGTNVSSSGSAPVQPYGDFVSSHSPSLNSNEVSICTTTPGATCQMTFSAVGHNTMTLKSQVTGSDGSTSWSWNTNSLGAGHWDVTVTAILNGKNSQAHDTIDISP